MALAQIQRGSLVESVIDQFRKMMETGEWRVGERIPVETRLAERLRVGRNTIREAVRVLAHAGMLETRQGAGTFVRAATDPTETLKRIDRAGLHERIEVRSTLEAEAARLAAVRHDDKDMTAIRAALRERAAAQHDAGMPDAIDQFVEIDARFHRTIVNAAHNTALADLYRYFAMATRETIHRTETEVDLPRPSQADHESLVEAIAARDPDAAATAARLLLSGTLAALATETAHD